MLIKIALAQNLVSFIQSYCKQQTIISEPNTIQYCLQGLYNFAIAILVVLAFIYFMIGALQYMLSPLVDLKDDGKRKMWGAIKGIIVIFLSGVVLYWINPNIFSAKLIVYRVSVGEPTFEMVEISEGGISLTNPPLPPDVKPENIPVTIKGKTITIPRFIYVKGLGTVDFNNRQTINFLGHNIEVNRAIVQKLQAINEEWLRMEGQNFYRVDDVSGYRLDLVEGTNKISAHTYGLAIDINGGTNLYIPKRTKTFTTDMPQRFVEIFIKNGMGWGGLWYNVKDPMHFSFWPGENQKKHRDCWEKIKNQLPPSQQKKVIKTDACSKQ